MHIFESRIDRDRREEATVKNVQEHRYCFDALVRYNCFLSRMECNLTLNIDLLRSERVTRHRERQPVNHCN